MRRDAPYKSLGLNKKKGIPLLMQVNGMPFLSSTDAGLGLTHLSVKKKSKEKGMSVP